MECGIALDEINEMKRLMSFDVPLKKLFMSMNSKKSWIKYVYYDMKIDNKNDNEWCTSVQVGKRFLENLIWLNLI